MRRLHTNVQRGPRICMLGFEQRWLQDIDGFWISLLLIVISCNVRLRATIGREGDRDGSSINLFLMRPKIDIPAWKWHVCIYSSVSKQLGDVFERTEIKLEKSENLRPDFLCFFSTGWWWWVRGVSYIISRLLFLRLDVLTAKFGHSSVSASCWQGCQEKRSVRLHTYEKVVSQKSFCVFIRWTAVMLLSESERTHPYRSPLIIFVLMKPPRMYSLKNAMFTWDWSAEIQFILQHGAYRKGTNTALHRTHVWQSHRARCQNLSFPVGVCMDVCFLRIEWILLGSASLAFTHRHHVCSISWCKWVGWCPVKSRYV